MGPPRAEAVSHGAITIVNAMATGKGAAVGINLWTKAKVTLTNEPGLFAASNLSDQTESTRLVEVTAQHILNRLGCGRRFGAIVETQSNIPIAVGLKSSSAVANAVSLACVKALGKRISDIQIVKLGVEASLRAEVTVTGAYDDACACYLGGVVVTDNSRMRILKRFKPKGRLRVLVHVPNQKKYTRDIDRAPLKSIQSAIQVAHKEALRGNYWNALTLNGLAYSSAFGYDTAASIEALSAGALAAGLSGKGPAIAAIVPDSKAGCVRSAWRHLRGRILETKFNFEKATARRVTD
jgi:shikimate kinase